ncbi:uncharacterized protein [Phyllobates terribilis]|uniref:uncharacterized protein n=1 Tax=Phyllobates terribilis TaxID=111132 RepID=UPI003CCB0156
MSSGVNLSNLAPLDVSISFLIKMPYDLSSQNSLKAKANNWVNKTLFLLPNITTAENSSVTVTNISGWTLYSAVFPIITPLFFDVDAALSNFTSNRKNAEFTIVPSTLTIQEKSPTFNTISPPLRILLIPQSLDLSTKSSAAFQQYSKAIEDSFKDIFGDLLVEPVVTSFTNDPLSGMASVDLYFQSDAINNTTVITQTEANVGTFTNRNLNLDLFLLDPKVGVQVKSTFMQDYTSDLSNASSSNATELQKTMLDLLTPELRKFYGNSLQDPPSVTFRNSDGLAAMDINYKLNYTTNVESSLMLESLLNNTGLINITRISSLSVNGNKPVFDAFTLNLRFINQDYGDDLKNRNSPRFIELRDKIKEGLKDILKDFNLKQIFVQSFQQGSVVGTVETTFPYAATSYSQVTQTIVNNKDVFTGMNLNLDPQSLYTSPVAPTNAPPGSSVPGYGVAIIVMCILLILAIPLVIVLDNPTLNTSDLTAAANDWLQGQESFALII